VVPSIATRPVRVSPDLPVTWKIVRAVGSLVPSPTLALMTVTRTGAVGVGLPNFGPSPARRGSTPEPAV
jgi:hypothetical protein